MHIHFGDYTCKIWHRFSQGLSCFCTDNQHDRNFHAVTWRSSSCQRSDRHEYFLAAFLIPIGVMIYTLVGGLKATFVADYMHTIVIFVVILTFVAAVYLNSDITGGVEGMYEKLVEAS